ncbi:MULTISPECIES: alpha/beta fold hydrolase [Streptomyces violaceusniger group]|uniref:Alpha/beta fold hydrolase n=1 Tax=Streptomyces antimycoticus TaxID=68175 RepID=A0ABD5J968_9ACTN|nr:alpha/beta fold hydrolase [Streptomyces violaceusniger]MEE4584316.1 alpha/beta fold hydrolase [Streptomyces sp. DSM 41602]
MIAFDNRGVGASGGYTPDTIEAMARDAVLFIRALGFEQVDLPGLSMGGFIAQVIAAEEPQLVRRVVLAGTGPAGGPGIDKVTALTLQDIVKGLLTRKDPKRFLFFTDTEHGRREAPAFLERLKERTEREHPGPRRTAAPGRTLLPLPGRRTRRHLPVPRRIRGKSTRLPRILVIPELDTDPHGPVALPDARKALAEDPRTQLLAPRHISTSRERSFARARSITSRLPPAEPGFVLRTRSSGEQGHFAVYHPSPGPRVGTRGARQRGRLSGGRDGPGHRTGPPPDRRWIFSPGPPAA